MFRLLLPPFPNISPQLLLVLVLMVLRLPLIQTLFHMHHHLPPLPLNTLTHEVLLYRMLVPCFSSLVRFITAVMQVEQITRLRHLHHRKPSSLYLQRRPKSSLMLSRRHTTNKNNRCVCCARTYQLCLHLLRNL